MLGDLFLTSKVVPFCFFSVYRRPTQIFGIKKKKKLPRS